MRGMRQAHQDRVARWLRPTTTRPGSEGMSKKAKVPLDTDCAHGPAANWCEVRMTLRLCQACAKALMLGQAHVKVELDRGGVSLGSCKSESAEPPPDLQDLMNYHERQAQWCESEWEGGPRFPSQALLHRQEIARLLREAAR